MLFDRTITRRDREYRITADLDDKALMDNDLTVVLSASYRERKQGEWSEWQTIRLTIRTDFEKRAIEVLDGDRVIARVPLDSEVPESVESEGNDLDVEGEGESLRPHIDAGIWEGIIQDVPVDMFFGCIIKGAVSTLVGQIIRCCNRVEAKTDRLREYIGEIASCLKEHGLKMAFTFVCRAGRCMVLAGFG